MCSGKARTASSLRLDGSRYGDVHGPSMGGDQHATQQHCITKINITNVREIVVDLCWVLAQVNGLGTARQHDAAIWSMHINIYCCVLRYYSWQPSWPRLPLRLHQETQHTGHIQYLYLGAPEGVYNSFKGCKADPAEAHVHEGTPQVGGCGIQLEEMWEA